MILTTRGIVLKTVNYSETSIIARVYTEEMGLRSYILKGIRGGKNKAKQNLLQPLSLLDMNVYENPKKEIQQVKDMKPAEPFLSIPFDMTKLAVVFFMDELLCKTLKEPFTNQRLFHFIYNSILELDATTDEISRFHLHFMLKLTHHLGFEPFNNYSEGNPYFNLNEGCFQPEIKDLRYSQSKEISLNMHKLINHVWKGESCPELNRMQRNTIQETLMKYYEVHSEQFGVFHSHEILKEVLR